MKKLSESPQKYAIQLRYFEYNSFEIGSDDNKRKTEFEDKTRDAEKRLNAANERVDKRTENLKKVSTSLDTARVVIDVYKNDAASQDEIAEIKRRYKIVNY